ncbi:MAG: PmoA family protein [Acidobacteria bacterium Pan2503]|uniref:PmoA family protein n=1 Tax=Candidatus Acidiferrum panamense TaxID=2741543 RepID=A0A7V8NRR4_9BACT|nr:PmoA family protein [Candidatus Acidoferrum panamensis]
MHIRLGGPIVSSLVLLWVLLGSAAPHSSDRISVTVHEEQRRVDISIDGHPFTSYIWPDRLAKPVLYPLRTANGTIITRGYPLDPRPGERVDHPHHVGMWLNYENVNGIDFWNNSEAIKPEDAPKMGTIRHRSIIAAEGGSEEGKLEVEADWLTYSRKVLLQEHTSFVFRGGPDFRSVDRITTLRAQDEKVVFADAKDGMLGLRVVRALEMPSDKAEVFTDASGRATAVGKLDNTGVNGVYLTSEGKKGEAAWGTRGRWCNLSGKIGDEPVTITILDHPANPGFPTYWHARGYGLFAANPLGEKVFSNGKEELNLSLAPHQTVTFRYRILISSGVASPESTEAAYKAFVAAYP